ncbi:hypothetical protein U472_15545 [Orenia metallireducens]|jgi:succinate dehydrogenase flavin-adding protein (antitoxin of CptAB toxin-antitoxin module)|uniref:Uncharacterized protein n=1 Tax=Orenia metallireducens TaxID=1413210 RepID=A0A1C0A6K6_9FIRM|nr:hypothetical protein [Orenia metallireducens]OCL25736.1 hypothetical protein U472_15545 [Orenia metallireducens]
MRSRKGEFDQFIDCRYDEELDNWITQQNDFDSTSKVQKAALESITEKYKYDLPWNDDYYPF